MIGIILTFRAGSIRAFLAEKEFRFLFLGGAYTFRTPGAIEVLVESFACSDVDFVFMPRTNEALPSGDVFNVRLLDERSAHMVANGIEAVELAVLSASEKTYLTTRHRQNHSCAPTTGDKPCVPNSLHSASGCLGKDCDHNWQKPCLLKKHPSEFPAEIR